MHSCCHLVSFVLGGSLIRFPGGYLTSQDWLRLFTRVDHLLFRFRSFVFRVDLMQLVEEATEGCWIGHRARMFTSEIGSVYSPPKTDRQGQAPPAAPLSGIPNHVETVIDIGHNVGVGLNSIFLFHEDLRVLIQGEP